MIQNSIAFTPKYRRKIIYYELREDIQKIIKDLCKWRGVEIIEGHIQNTYKKVGDRSNAKDIVKNIVKEQSGRYNAFITNYAMGFQETTLEMHKWLLYPILTADTDTLMQGLNYRSIRILLESVHPKKGELNPGNVTQALKSVVSLQLSKSIQPIILDYDESNLKLHIVDRGFVIWLKTQNRDEILELAGLPINLEN